MNYPRYAKGGAATMKDNRNEMGISRSSHTSAAVRSGRLPGGADSYRARVRETSQVCIRRGRKLSNRGLLPGRALSAKTGYEPVGDNRRVPRPLWPNDRAMP